MATVYRSSREIVECGREGGNSIYSLIYVAAAAQGSITSTHKWPESCQRRTKSLRHQHAIIRSCDGLSTISEVPHGKDSCRAATSYDRPIPERSVYIALMGSFVSEFIFDINGTIYLSHDDTRLDSL